MSAVDKQYAPLGDVPKRIHIVGTGSIGKLVAHCLRGLPDPPPVSLILHRYKLLEAWDKSRKVISLATDGKVTPRGGFDVELADEARKQHGVRVEPGIDVYDMADQAGIKVHEAAKIIEEQQKQNAGPEKEPGEAYKSVDTIRGRESHPGSYAISDEPIHNLIVTTKTIRTESALYALRHRISKDTTICFLQNGMGVIDDINKNVFPDESTRPSYLQGIVSHGANVPPEKAEVDPFFVVHAGHGTIALGAVPKRGLADPAERPPAPTGHGTDNSGELSEEQVDELPPSGRYLVRTLSRTPVLACVAFTPLELLQLQLEKLAVNSILNPLTALLDNRNGSLLYNYNLVRTYRLMLAETSLIIRSLPELRGIPNVPNRFSADRLEKLVVNVADKTQNNISSMLADVRRGAPTEIDYINGYIVKRGEDLGIKAVVNYAIMQTVLGKSRMTQRERADAVPVEGKIGEDGINRE